MVSMSKWKCEICGNSFNNFHAQGFNHQIYCPLCYFKELYKREKQENQQLKKQLKLYETYLNRFFKINNKSYDGKVVLEKLKQRDEVIEEAIKRCDLEISASSYQYEKNHRQQELVYKVAHERMKKILTKYKGDNNE